MKNIIYLLTILGVFSLFTSCADMLDTHPAGSTLTSEQKAAIIADNPSLLSADIAGLAAGLSTRNQSGGDQHREFGFASACIYMDSNGADMPGINGWANHYSGTTNFEDKIYTSFATEWTWNLYYKHMKTANDILNLVPTEAIAGADADPTLKAYRGQALTSRAWDYLNLIQLYQFTYVGNESKLGVPIITEKTTPEEAANNPRAPVKDVYDLIMSDLNEAITLLEGYSRPDKGTFDINVAYGIRARANLVMGQWADAAKDAAKARSGYTLLSLTDVSKPSFNTLSLPSVIWGNLITPENNVVKSGIINWPSMLSSLTGNGYTSLVGSYRRINVLLYDEIPSTDIRKQWWLDEDKKSVLVEDDYDNSIVKSITVHSNIKFGAYQNIIGNTVNASDWICMRAEEMLLIEAEGLAMSGQTGAAKTLLENWVKGHRDASYVCNASSDTDLQEEIWFQRRVELWGEGFSYHDIMRLKKPIIRVANEKTNFPDAWQFNVLAESDILLWRVPRDEVDANAGVSNADSPTTAPPLPGDNV